MYFGLQFRGAAHQDWDDDSGGSLRQLLTVYPQSRSRSQMLVLGLFSPFVVIVLFCFLVTPAICLVALIKHCNHKQVRKKKVCSGLQTTDHTLAETSQD